MSFPLFENLVREALDDLPLYFQEKLSNVAVVIEDLAPPEVLRSQGIRNPYQLLGLYQGIPQNKRGGGYFFSLPDRISIYRKAIEAQARTPQEVKELVKRVVRHEIGHHFGLSEEELAKFK